MELKTEKIINKIKNLRNIAKSTHSRSEAETAVAIAAKLIAEYQLSEAELEAVSSEKEKIDTTNEHIIYETGRTTAWKASLAVGIAILNGLFCFSSTIRHPITHRRGTRYRVIGRNSDIEIGIYMFNYLESTIQNLANAEFACGNFHVDENGSLKAKRGVNPLKESWCSGCVKGFIDKMKLASSKAMEGGSQMAMVLISNKAQEAKVAYVQETGIKFGKAVPSKANINNQQMVRGYAVGQTLTLRPSLNT